MRALVNLDEVARAEVVHAGEDDDNFDHLKIECRAKDKNHPHEAFGESLFNIMKAVLYLQT